MQVSGAVHSNRAPRGTRIRRRSAAGLAAALVVAGVGAALAWAEPGELDPEFGSAGIAAIDFGFRDSAEDVALAPDRDLVALGSSRDLEDDDYITLARFTPRGSLDPSFGDEGRLVLPIDDRDRVDALAVQEDGRILVAGVDVEADGQDFSLARFLPDGDPDTSFGPDGTGRVRTSVGGLDWVGEHGLAVQPDGRILLAGTSGRHALPMVLIRYRPEGVLDRGFGGEGRVVLRRPGAFDGIDALAVQPDGRIVIAGESNAGFLVARLRRDGRLDRSFGAGGWREFGLRQHDGDPYTGADLRAVALQEDGRIVVGGIAYRRGSDFAFARLTADGRLDPSFAGDGRRTVDRSDEESVFDLALDSRGRIVGGGYSGTRRRRARLAALRLRPSGRLDRAFGQRGVAILKRPRSATYGIEVGRARITMSAGVSTPERPVGTRLDLALVRLLGR